MAEREGFEPSVEETPYNRLAICPVRPLQHLSANKNEQQKVTKDVCKCKKKAVRYELYTASQFLIFNSQFYLAVGVGFEPTDP